MFLRQRRLFFILGFVFVCSVTPSLGGAATFCVDEATDDGTGNAADCLDAPCTGAAGICSLRDAIIKADTDTTEDVITFSSSASGHLDVGRNAAGYDRTPPDQGSGG